MVITPELAIHTLPRASVARPRGLSTCGPVMGARSGRPSRSSMAIELDSRPLTNRARPLSTTWNGCSTPTLMLRARDGSPPG
ncbi:hypothetical protein ACN93_15880 [Gordonia paraffinivorans]|nr:hypothetical protein ACN93_15880 [Gordonia paraffinivorans]